MKKQKKVIIILILTILLILNYCTGIFGVGNLKFNTFQNDSEYLVISRIYKDKYKVNNDNTKFGLVKIIHNDMEELENLNEKLEKNSESNEELQIIDYFSQFGLQGYIFSFLYNKIHLSITALHIICCSLLSIIIIAICYLILCKYGKLMSIVFYITFLLSPWVVVFAKNLYWVEFTWFLPALCGLYLSFSNYSKKMIIIPCIFLSILIKSLCGYEYISTIMLMTISFFIIDFFTTKDKNKRKKIIFTIIEVGITCILAFIIAMFIHASLRGNGNIIEGLKEIYENDVLRRTLISTDISQFGKEYESSLKAGIVRTVLKYFIWRTPIIIGISGKLFIPIFIINIIILIYNFVKKDKYAIRDITMFITFFITTLSWLILGKAHSYIHTHINFVLWYFGYIQISIYICVKFIVKILKKFLKINSVEKKNV